PGWQRDPPGWQRDPPGWQRDLPGWQRDPPGWQRDPPGPQRVDFPSVLVVRTTKTDERSGSTPKAVPGAGWDDLAAAISAAGARTGTRAVMLAAEGRGFCGRVDIKEMQRTQGQQGGHEALLGANRGCAAAFAAVYDCLVPVIAAVHGFCLGGGVGLAG